MRYGKANAAARGLFLAHGAEVVPGRRDVLAAKSESTPIPRGMGHALRLCNRCLTTPARWTADLFRATWIGGELPITFLVAAGASEGLSWRLKLPLGGVVDRTVLVKFSPTIGRPAKAI